MVAVDPTPVRRVPVARAIPEHRKSVEQKYYENAFFQLVGQILVAVDDPRKDAATIPKLGFAELQALIEVLQVADPMASVQTALKLLTLDAALKRHDLLWWDNATEHVIPED
jgi:hypothetical protein